MHRFISTLFLLLIISVNSYGQYGTLDWLSNFEKTVFDSIAIRKKKITKVYVIETSGKRDANGFAEKRDTLSIYNFDTLGHIIAKNTRRDSALVKINLTAVDSTIMEYILRNYGVGMDTALVVKKVYLKNGKLIEEELTPTEFHKQAMSCITGDNYHYKYEYDKYGRIVYYQDLKYWYYKRVHYTDYGKKVETYDFKNSTLLDTEFILINKVHDLLNDTWTTTETNRTKQVSKSYVDNLLKIETIVTIDFFPTVKYIEYEYE